MLNTSSKSALCSAAAACWVITSKPLPRRASSAPLTVAGLASGSTTTPISSTSSSKPRKSCAVARSKAAIVWPRPLCSSGSPKLKMPTSSKRRTSTGPLIAYASPITSPLSSTVSTSAANSPGPAGSRPSTRKKALSLKLNPSAGGPCGTMASPAPSTITTLKAATPGWARRTPGADSTAATSESAMVGRSKSEPNSWTARAVRSTPEVTSSARSAKVARRLSVSVNTATTNITPMTTTSVVSAKRTAGLSPRLWRRGRSCGPPGTTGTPPPAARRRRPPPRGGRSGPRAPTPGR